MINIRRHPALNPNSKIVAGFDMTFYKAFEIAFEKGQKAIWQRLIEHNRSQVMNAIGKDSLPILQQTIFLPVYLFYVVQKNQEAVNGLVKDITSSYKIIAYAFRPGARRADLPAFSKSIIDKFTEGALAFFHTIIFLEDKKVLSDALNEFNQMKEDRYDQRTRVELENLIKGGGGPGIVSSCFQNV